MSKVVEHSSEPTMDSVLSSLGFRSPEVPLRASAPAFTDVRRAVLQRCCGEPVSHPSRSDWPALSWLRQQGLVERRATPDGSCEYVATNAGRAILLPRPSEQT